MKAIKAVRGMYDSYGMDSRLWGRLDQAWGQIMHAHAYDQLRSPIVEPVGLFARAIGEVTDVVEKRCTSLKIVAEKNRTAARGHCRCRPSRYRTGSFV